MPTIDFFTALHFLTGIFLSLGGLSRSQAYLIIGATEIAEQGFRDANIFPTFFAETKLNIAADLIASTAGYETGRLIFGNK